MALFRALESSRGPQRLFEDPCASAFLSRSLRLVVSLAGLPVVGAAVPRLIDWGWPGARSSGVARTRLIDDLLLAAGGACGQVILLGSGFDARPYRLPALSRARVFEVDHPATLAEKRRALARRLGALPANVSFVAVDFECDDLESSLRSAGFDGRVPSFFVWEGVTNYLTAEAIDATLRAVAHLGAAGGRLLFTYVHRGVLDGSIPFPGARRLSETLQRIGEPWTFGLDPREIAAFLADRGFRLLGDWGAAEYRRRYWGESASWERGYEFYRAALAGVAEGSPRTPGGSAACQR